MTGELAAAGTGGDAAPLPPMASDGPPADGDGAAGNIRQLESPANSILNMFIQYTTKWKTDDFHQKKRKTKESVCYTFQFQISSYFT